MSATRYDVLGVGNAIVDVIATTDDQFLTDHEVAKGGMTLIDEPRAASLYAAMPPAQEISGGSAANTLAGVASFGGRAAYLGKVADDQLGDVFAHDLRAAGVEYDTPPLTDGPSTARCLIMVTPDAQRSMNTFLGASTMFSASDIDDAKIADAAYVYLEGYLFDRDEAKAAFVRAAEVARAAGRQVALTLSDGFCVDRHRASFRQLVARHVDVVFANEDEILSLYQTEDFDDAVAQVRGDNALAFLTRSEKGSLVVSKDGLHPIAIEPVSPGVVDTTGAGDLYAAGALFGLSQGRPLDECGRLGAIAAAEVISHVGARPMVSLRERGAAVIGS